MPPESIVKSGIALSPEGRRILPHLTVAENLQLGAYIRTDKAEIAKDIDWVYSLFPRLHERAWQKGGTLSGGEQQMLAVGRALMSRPELVMLDEPSLGLAPILVREIFTIIKRINEAGTTVLLIEQNAFAALSVAHYAYILELPGGCKGHPRPVPVVARERAFKHQHLKAVMVVKVHMQGGDNKVVRIMLGRGYSLGKITFVMIINQGKGGGNICANIFPFLLYKGKRFSYPRLAHKESKRASNAASKETPKRVSVLMPNLHSRLLAPRQLPQVDRHRSRLDMQRVNLFTHNTPSLPPSGLCLSVKKLIHVSARFRQPSLTPLCQRVF
ncbi:hypothetical protein B566_EDAN018838 [Ephemera danica]|nr:hypothetical protein B566_EDAN018838 [Ephemera danica]